MSGGGGDNKVKETPEEKELAQISREKYKLYKDKIVPLENLYMDRVRKDEADYERAGREVSSAYGGAFRDAAEGAKRTQMASGGMPGSGRFVSALGEVAADQGEKTSAARVDTGNRVEDLHYEGLENVLAMGAGQPINAQQGLSDVAGLETQEAIGEARDSFRRSSANASAAGTVAGMAGRWGQEQFGGGVPDSTSSYSQVNAPDARDYQTAGGYRGSGF